ncbi:hypothetical protein K458DRAFT_94583 [Lentithecium fluviatile CBS 122367]|uniref:Uncharacterized protein n=1 Tax=Lentithecium fluviatile CBS 122367 TaxID=1168545 RepID=A0A6G1IQ46_9PLEO|nr:hypothetical protein K458DRAFT_94583 [Lentithecium fluviatile CBS 122367]
MTFTRREHGVRDGDGEGGRAGARGLRRLLRDVGRRLGNVRGRNLRDVSRGLGNLRVGGGLLGRVRGVRRGSRDVGSLSLAGSRGRLGRVGLDGSGRDVGSRGRSLVDRSRGGLRSRGVPVAVAWVGGRNSDGGDSSSNEVTHLD